ncbi:hypothetical protein ABPG74_015379 [Tetrahymena malaccensis]
MNKILITFTILNLLLLVVSQDYISSNSSQSGTIEFARYQNNSPCSKANETIKSQNFQFQFQNTPQVLIGIVFFDLDTTKYTIAFNFTIQSVDKKQTSIQLNRYGDTCIWGIGITYFAVDDDDIKIQSYTLYFNSSNDISDQNKKQYQFAIQQAEKKRDVQCAISGFNSTYLIPPSNDITYSHRNFQLTTQVDSTNNFYFIQMQAPDLAVNLKIIYVNCIEYYIGQAGDYSMINNIQLQQSTQQITTSQNFQINLDSSFIGNSISSFLGLQQFDLTQSSALRIEYQNFNFQNNQFTFQVITWASSILYSSSILFFQHQMIDCKSSKSLINSNNLKQCVSSCPDGQYPASFQSTLVCSPCNSICKTCSSLNVCTSCQSNQFLDPSSQSCSNCDSNCLTCSSSSQQCLSCHQDYFLYNKTCQQDQPQGTYCDKSKTCQDCQKSYQCYYCQEKLQVCLKCIENLYFLNGVCSTQQPPNTYCIKNDNIDKYCQNCHPTCSQCFGQQLNQCLACQQGYQLVNSSCLCQQGYGYSTFSQQCEACKVNGCTQCSMNLNQCEICQTQFILDQKTGKCHCPNLQQYYSSEQQKCIQNQIQFCKISSLFENTCDQCLDGYYNYNKLLCSYCGKSKYTDSKNDCVNDCLPSCIICSNDSSCLLYQNDIDNNQTGNLPSDQKSMSIFNQGICDYSCGLCNGGGKTNCLICSSQSRIYDVQQQTCYCKSDSLDKGQAECQTPYDISQKIDNQYITNYKTTQMCTPCNLTCRTCQNSYSCSSCQLSQFIDPSTSLCANCDLNCLACTNSSTQCTMCKPGWFLYNQVCYQIQPNGTYCDLNNNCQTCGALPLCKYCDKSLQNCIHCMSEQDYLLNGVCSSQQPPNTYCNQQNICQQCPDTCQGCDFMLNCIQCVNQQYFFYFGKCYQKQPINTYCTLYSGIQNYCQNCHPSCSQCFGKQVNQCLACQEGFRLVNTSCTCQNLGYGFNDASQQCEVCQISGCIQCSMSLSQCELCSKELQLDQQSGQCYCLNQFQYYSIEQKSCIFNKVQFCKISSKFQNTCEQCQDGYYNFKNQLCTYCGKFKYSNSQNQCINNCQKGCIICIDNQSCLLSQTDVQNNQNGNLPIDTDKKFCHYSCRLCNGSGNQNCLMCSSQTRIYDALTQTCTCKDGYFDTGISECQLPFEISFEWFNSSNSLFEYFQLFNQFLFHSTNLRKSI